ncbi:MAG: hypothetical protein AAF998_12010 [Bacteroidota bacterium]
MGSNSQEKFDELVGIFSDYIKSKPIAKAIRKTPYYLAHYLITQRAKNGWEDSKEECDLNCTFNSCVKGPKCENQDIRTKYKTIEMVELFHTMSMYFGKHDHVEILYLELAKARRAFLTDGILVLPSSTDTKCQTSRITGWQYRPFLTRANYEDDLNKCGLTHDGVKAKIQTWLEKNDTTGAMDNFYLWPGSKMIIPDYVEILICHYSKNFLFQAKVKDYDPKDEYPPKLVVVSEVENAVRVVIEGVNSEFFVEEKPQKIAAEIKILNGSGGAAGDKLNPGFYDIQLGGLNYREDNFSKIVFRLNNREQYDYELWIPYLSPRYEVMGVTKLKPANGGSHKLVVSCIS